MTTSYGRSLVFAGLFCAFLSLFVSGQDLDNVTILGRVTDRTGLPVAGATVNVFTDGETPVRTITSDGSGRFHIVQLAPGSYTVKVESTGFAIAERKLPDLLAGREVQLDLVMEPAGVLAEATVVSDEDEPVVDSTGMAVGSTIERLEVEELPNADRNPFALVMNLGGVAEEALSTSDLADDNAANHRSTPFEQGNFSISGGASYSNNLTIDGLDNNDDRSARDRFQPSIEAIAEVQVIRNQFSAEYGRASGGRVNFRTRSGTNRFRGRAFMFYRDSAFNANTWYNNSRGIPRPPMSEYNPGIVFGGPLSLSPGNRRNRTFFSVVFEQQRADDTTLIDTFVPVVQNPRFALPQPTGSQQYCDNANPANCPATAGFISPYSVFEETPNVGNILIARVDHRFSKGNDITFGWQYGRRNNRRTRAASVTRIEEALQARNIETDALNFSLNSVLSSKAVNQFRFQWSSFEPSFQTDNPDASVVLISYRNPITNGTQTLIAGNSTASNLQDFASSRKETRFQFQEALTYVTGRHTIKIGFDLQTVNSRAVALGDATGTFNFNGVQNYSDNVLSRFRQNFGTASDVKNTYFGVYFNDAMILRRNLRFSYGLRYERESAVSDNNNFGPRIGISWDPFKKRKDVIRFGAGTFYNRVLLRTVGDFIQNTSGRLEMFDSNTIPTTNNARANVLAQIALNFPNGFSSADDLRSVITAANCGPVANPIPCSPTTGFLTNTSTSGNPLRSVDPDLRIPESYQFNIGYQREIRKGWVVEANYTINKTTHLWREYNTNLPVLPSGYDDYTAYLLANPFTFVNFNGTVRTYQFYLGPTNDPSGVSTNPANQTGTCGTTVNVTCWINLNTVNTSTITPNSNAGDGVSSNSVGGPIGVAKLALRHLRPDPTTDEKERVASIGNAFYQGLVIELRRRYRNLGGGFGASMRAAYTLSRTMDDGLNNTSNAEISGDFSREWARARQDRLHRFAFTAVIETPQRFGKLRLSPVFRYGSSGRFNLGYGIDRNLNDSSTDRVRFSGNLKDIRWRKPGSPVPTALLSQFSLQPIGARSGNLPRNVGIGPSQFVFDLGVTREWRFGERFRLRPNVEFGNILNMAIFSFGSEFVDFIGVGPNPTPTQQRQIENFLVPTRTFRQRQIRFGVRFDF